MGHVESVDIEGFKCLKSVSLECGQFNLITGRNGTGKSSVLEAIELAHDPRSLEMLGEKIDHLINIQSENIDIEVKGRDSVSLSISKPSEEAAIDFARQASRSATRIYVQQKFGDDHEDTNSILEKARSKVNIPSDEKLRQISEQISEIKNDIYVVSRDDNSHALVNINNWVTESEERLDSMRDKMPDRALVTNFYHPGSVQFITTPEFYRVKHIKSRGKQEIKSDSDNELYQVRVRDFLRDHDIFPNLESFSFDELVFDEDGEQYAIPYDFLGDGTKTIIGIVWQLVADDEIPDVVLLEEPENHLHPGYVKELVPFLIDFAREEDVQLFVTSHNVDFISELLSDSLSEDHREWLAEEFRLIQMTNLSPKQFDYDRAKHHTEELHLDLRGL